MEHTFPLLLEEVEEDVETCPLSAVEPADEITGIPVFYV